MPSCTRDRGSGGNASGRQTGLSYGLSPSSLKIYGTSPGIRDHLTSPPSSWNAAGDYKRKIPYGSSTTVTVRWISARG